MFPLVCLLLAFQTLGTWNGKTVGTSSGNISSLDGKTIGTASGNYNKWNNLNSPSGTTPIALVQSAKAVGTTTSSTNFTGANLFYISCHYYGSLSGVATDSQGNTYTSLTGQQNGGFGSWVQLFRATGTASSSMTHACPGGTAGVTIAYGFSSGSPTYESQSGAVAPSGGTIQPGSLTCSVNGCLYVTAMTLDQGGTTPTINSGFSSPDGIASVGGVNCGGFFSYLIQTTAAATNPTWDPNLTGFSVAVAMADMKP